MLKEFKDFAFKGNMIDMAVGIIIGAAFGTVVKSLVNNLFMPVLGKITGGINFTEMYLNLNFPDEKVPYAEALAAGEPVIGYGQFLTDLLSFLLVAFAVFLVVKKAMSVFQTKEDEITPDAPPEPSQEAQLLIEIRDLLKKEA